MFALQQASVFVVLEKRVITVVVNKGIEYQGLRLAKWIGLSDASCAKLKAKSDEVKLVMLGSDEQIVKYYQNYNPSVESVEQSYNKAGEMLNEIESVRQKKKEVQKEKEEKTNTKTSKFNKVMDMFKGSSKSSEQVDDYAI